MVWNIIFKYFINFIFFNLSNSNFINKFFLLSSTLKYNLYFIKVI